MGILIATVILAITYMLVEDEISDSEVIARAKKLGMVEADSTVIRQQEATPESIHSENPSGENQPTEDSSQPQDTAGQSTTEPEGTLQPPGEDSQGALMQTPQVEPAPENASQPQADDSTVSITISPGQDGVTICSMLQDKGVISDAADFSNYLSQNRLQTNIRHGTFELHKGMSYEDLVKKIIW